MTARELYQAGKLAEAVQALNAELRDNPGDAKRRTFLFELLCFAGNFDRADKQLEILAQESADAQLGALVYRAALHAERIRSDLFQKKEYPQAAGGSAPAAYSGSWNGKPFQSISDMDARIGSRLEVFAAGQYLWLPFEHVESIEVQAPKRLRDLIWATAILRPSAAFQGRELGEVLLPVLCPLSSQQADDALKLGRSTEWKEIEPGEVVPFGQKMFLIDDEEVPILELRQLEIRPESSVDQHVTAG
jgi:type VI secretion system protein ImpE